MLDPHFGSIDISQSKLDMVTVMPNNTRNAADRRKFSWVQRGSPS